MRLHQHSFALPGRRVPSQPPGSAQTGSSALLRGTVWGSRWMWRVRSYSLPLAQPLLLQEIRFSSMAGGRHGSWVVRSLAKHHQPPASRPSWKSPRHAGLRACPWTELRIFEDLQALVLSVDEKSQIQALDRTQPILPLRPGIPERQTHDYERHGTTTLFAALNVLEGTVIGECQPRHSHQEFLNFLERIDRSVDAELAIHLVLDNYGTH